MLDKFHNSNSSVGVDLISYLYGEMDEATRTDFESHLAGCDECAVELGSYADARLGVIEWRRNDFEPLATPAIIIPEAQPVATSAATQPRRSWTGWIEAVSSLPRLVQAGMGLATTALLFGVFYFGFGPVKSGPGDVNIAEKTANPVAAPESNVAPAPAPSEQAKTTGRSEFERGSVRIADHRSATERSGERPVTAVIHQTPAMRNYRRIGTLEAVTTAPKAQAALRLNTFDDEEDTTLRLSDLFSQVGPGKK